MREPLRQCRRCGGDVAHRTGPPVCSDCSEVREVIWRSEYVESRRDTYLERWRANSRRRREQRRAA